MSIKAIITRGFGTAIGTIKDIVTRGFASGLVQDTVPIDFDILSANFVARDAIEYESRARVCYIEREDIYFSFKGRY